ncbi:hypothetical protein HNQ51_002376 [Inhella inkyongensis]|uniref:Uncharacterized protein n=1 Tax=Inhella inkyongensis TaxID=392593 RepID=A0A840S1N2_9BURK|nr:hypothetical protein [Inhella inkyongensis]MBB5205057.1 hypothetical protein [Inhella inkyongensis]
MHSSCVRRLCGPREFIITTPIQIGKYRVSAFARQSANGRFLSSVSIKSGQGQASHDRVLRFSPEFDSMRHALRFAQTHGREQALLLMAGARVG